MPKDHTAGVDPSAALGSGVARAGTWRSLAPALALDPLDLCCVCVFIARPSDVAAWPLSEVRPLFFSCVLAGVRQR